MTLADYLEQNGLTQAAFAARIDAHPITVNRWATGRVMPRRPQIEAIEKATAGAVTASDLVSAFMRASAPAPAQ